MLKYWARQLTVVINRTASRSILVGATNRVNGASLFQTILLSPDQCDSQSAVNSIAAQEFIQNFDLSLMDQERIQF